jgi:hypothetical protein
MKVVVTGYDSIFGPWLMDKVQGHWILGKGHTIGLYDTVLDRPIAAVYYEGCNGASIMLHCAGEGRTWLNREFLWYVFHYAFVELEVNKIISPVESDNSDSRRFIEHIGFSLEATLKDASPKGDLLIYSLAKSDCKWLDLRNKYRGQTQSTKGT